MATTSTVPSPSLPYGPAREFRNVARAELRKLSTVRSTYWTLFAVLVFNIGTAAALAIFVSDRLTPQDLQTVDTVRLTLGGIHLSQVAIGVLGVLAISAEYSTGMIRATFAAVPQRRLVLTAKSLVFAVTALAVGAISSFGAFLVFQALRRGNGLKASLGDPGILRAVIGGSLYLAVLGLFGLGLGAIIRATAGAVAALLGILFVPSLLLQLLPHSWQTTLTPYVPMEAGGQIFIATKPDADSLAPWTGFGVFCLWAAVALVVGYLLIAIRDT